MLQYVEQRFRARGPKLTAAVLLILFYVSNILIDIWGNQLNIVHFILFPFSTEPTSFCQKAIVHC